MKSSKWFEALFICFALVLAASCSQNLYVKADHPQFTEPEPKKAASPGAIWAGENSNNSLFSDRRAKGLNDVVTIVVNESATGGNNATTQTSRDTSTSAGITSLLGFEQNLQRALGNVSVGGTSSNSLKGAGQTTRNGNLTAMISAKVVKVLVNGNFVIEGRRLVTVNAEDQYLTITGIIRPDDIAFDNSILSQYIADAKLVYTGKGVVDDKQRPGWLTRIVDWIWPF